MRMNFCDDDCVCDRCKELKDFKMDTTQKKYTKRDFIKAISLCLSFSMEIVAKRMEINGERDFYARWIWEAESGTSNLSNRKRIECEWDGFGTEKECIDDFIKTIFEMNK